MLEQEIPFKAEEIEAKKDELFKLYEEKRSKLVRFCQKYCYNSPMLKTAKGDIYKVEAEDLLHEYFLHLYKELLEKGDYNRSLALGLKNRGIDEIRSKRTKIRKMERELLNHRMISSEESEDDFAYMPVRENLPPALQGLEMFSPEEAEDNNYDCMLVNETPSLPLPEVLNELIHQEDLTEYSKVFDSVTKKFPPQMWEVLSLILQDFEYEEIAEQLQIPQECVRKEYYKAADRFRTAYSRRNMLPLRNSVKKLKANKKGRSRKARSN